LVGHGELSESRTDSVILQDLPLLAQTVLSN
jgi:hypothetical protein